MQIRRTTAALAAAATLAVTAGCSGGGQDAVAWTDKVCGALSGFTQAATAQPDIDPTDPAAAVRGLTDYLGRTTTALDGAITELKAAGPAPVEGGDQYVTTITSTLTDVRNTFDSTRTSLAAIDTSDPQAIVTALPAAVAPLQELTDLADPTEGLQASEELRKASESAPKCQQLRTAS